MSAYYNEHDPFAAAWLRELIKEGLIADGTVDDRSIVDVLPADLRGYTQCHFFAGIGGWSHALRLAGWPDDRPAWTGSCPCQPFSSAGKGDGEADPRDLWPAWFRLVRECRPDVVFGEQVEAAARGGWFDRLSADLEGEDYAVGACVLGAHSVGAYHRRQRLWFVARFLGNSAGARCEWRKERGERDQEAIALSRQRSESRRVAHDHHQGSLLGESDGEPTEGVALQRGDDLAGCGPDGRVADREIRGQRIHGRASRTPGHLDECGSTGWMGDGGSARSSELGGQRDESERLAAAGFWRDVVWLPCRDGKARPVESTIQPLAHGIRNRLGLLRGAGNAIVPQVAQVFIESYLACIAPA